MGYSFSEESLSVGAVVDDSSLCSSVNRKLVSGRMPIKMQVFFLCHRAGCATGSCRNRRDCLCQSAFLKISSYSSIFYYLYAC